MPSLSVRSSPIRTISPQPQGHTRRGRQLIVHKFCQYRRRSDPTCFVPDPLSFARPQPYRYRAPVLVEPEQIARMLACATALPPTVNSPLRAAVLRLAIVLLYTAGLRRGEVLRLTLADIDNEVGVLRVRESKFHKSRFVPLSPSAHEELGHYLRERFAICEDRRPTAPLLCNPSRGWCPYTDFSARAKRPFAVIWRTMSLPCSDRPQTWVKLMKSNVVTDAIQ